MQVGTPEEVVAHPANDYVADFLDVPRAHVLTARAIMRPANGRRRQTARQSVPGPPCRT